MVMEVAVVIFVVMPPTNASMICNLVVLVSLSLFQFQLCVSICNNNTNNGTGCTCKKLDWQFGERGAG
jgi:hypothetical protein